MNSETIEKQNEENTSSTQPMRFRDLLLETVKNYSESLIAISAATIAVILFMWRILVYMYDTAYLVCWGIDAVYAPYFTPQGVFVAAILFLLTIFVVLKIVYIANKNIHKISKTNY